MKTLLLARHAKSDWVDLALDDHDRPLAARGLRDAPAMGERLVAEGVRVDRIVTSTAARALATAYAYAAAFGIEEGDVVVEAALYGASSRTILRIASEQPEDARVVMLVGHNPGMSVAVDDLTSEWLDLPTCAVAECSVPSWQEVDTGAGALVRLRAPRD